MAKRQVEFEVPVDSVGTRAACLAALRDLNWTILVDRETEIEAREDVARLCCGSSPVGVEIALTARGDGCCRLALRADVGGFGPLASQSLGCVPSLQTRILAQARAGGRAVRI